MINKCTGIFGLLFLTLLSACRQSSRYPGYDEIYNGVYCRLIDPGDGERKVKEGDYLELKMINSAGGKAFYNTVLQSARGTILLSFSGNRYFSALSEGDSAVILLPAGELKYPGTPDTGMVEMHIRVTRILDQGAYEKYIQQLDVEADEQLLISRYLKQQQSWAQPDSNGIYIESEIKGEGAYPEEKKTVRIRGEGTFLNGLVFDKSLSGVNGTSFSWGVEGQFVEGFEKMLKQMRVGGKAKIVLPSRLAFGTRGSVNGIVPPNTPVVYTLELLSIE
jgi:FKBP-type peptidyl-prolyl cis-trans isomerase